MCMCGGGGGWEGVCVCVGGTLKGVVVLDPVNQSIHIRVGCHPHSHHYPILPPPSLQN